MGVRIDKTRKQRAPVCVNDVVRVGGMLAGDDRRDEPVPDLYLAEERQL
jgi:hypothetical protein